MVTPQHAYRDWLKVVAKTGAKQAKTKSSKKILILLTINTWYVASRLVHVWSLGKKKLPKKLIQRNWIKKCSLAKLSKFFNNPENKKDLNKSVCCYFQTDERRNLIEIPLRFSWYQTAKKLKKLIFDEAAAVVAKDTGALGQLECVL